MVSPAKRNPAAWFPAVRSAVREVHGNAKVFRRRDGSLEVGLRLFAPRTEIAGPGFATRRSIVTRLDRFVLLYCRAGWLFTHDGDIERQWLK